MILISLSDQLHGVALPSKMTLNGVKQIATMRMKMVAHMIIGCWSMIMMLLYSHILGSNLDQTYLFIYQWRSKITL